MGTLFSLAAIGDPWDYLNGTSYSFGLDAGDANTVLTAIFLFVQNAALAVAVILIFTSIFGMIWSSNNTQERAQGKKCVQERLFALFIIGSASGILTLLMTVCNLLFGIA